MRFLVLLLLSGTILASCENRTEAKRLQEETEKVHDEAMASMAAMQRTRRGLQKQLDTIPARSAASDSIRAAIVHMEETRSDMMNWMAAYQKPDKLPAPEAEAYLKEQLLLIRRNKRDIEAADSVGRHFLKGNLTYK